MRSRRASRPSQIEEDIVSIIQSQAGGCSNNQIRAILREPPYSYPADEQSHVDRRMRQLKIWWHIEKERRGGFVFYKVLSRRLEPLISGRVGGRLRAQVLNEAHGRCAMCGATIKRDAIRLEVDHKIPLSWGGANDIENLQALCISCNHGKRNFFESIEDDGVKRAALKPIVHERIATLLEIHHGKPIPSSFLSLVAAQDDWQKRLRELRELGWKISVKRSKSANGKHATTYSAVRIGDWPVNIAKQLREAKLRRAKST